MKGRGRVKRSGGFFVRGVPTASWERARASKEPGSTLAKPSEGLGVDAGDERRILAKDDAYVVLKVPITVKEALSRAPAGCQPFIRRSPT